MPSTLQLHQITLEAIGDIAIVKFKQKNISVEGDADQACEDLEKVAGLYNKMLVNFEGVVNIASIMLGKLVGITQRMKKHGGGLVLCNMTPCVLAVFESTQLGTFLTIHTTLERGMTAIKL